MNTLHEFSFNHQDYNACYDRPMPPIAHRRTGSNASSASSSAVNQGYIIESDEIGLYSNKRSDNSDAIYHDYHQQWKQPSGASTPQRGETYYSVREQPDRPGSLGLGLELGVTKLRSSLKKYNSQKNSGSRSGGSSGGGTPTNPTPPDSLTSDDSSYLSAKDSSSSQSRVRFSPETLLDAAVYSSGQQNLDTVQLISRRSRRLDRDFSS